MKLQVGQKVYCMLYGGQYGHILAIRGEQRPESVRSLGGIVCTGGNAYFDVVFLDHISNQIPETIIHGCQWQIYDEVIGPADLAERVKMANIVEARKKEWAEAKEERRSVERQNHLAANPHLKQRNGCDWSGGRLSAANIRTELKRAFPGFRFKVTSDHNSVDVRWTDGPSAEQVKQIVGRYELGSFDGMNDTYNLDDDATFADVFGGVRYAFCQREATLEGFNQALVLHGYDPIAVPPDQCSDYWLNTAYNETDLYQLEREANLFGQAKASEHNGVLRMLAINERSTIIDANRFVQSFLAAGGDANELQECVRAGELYREFCQKK